MRAVDTNVLVRLLTGDEPAQTVVAEQFVAQGAWVSILALAETIWVLGVYYHRSKAELLAIIERLIEQETVTLQDSDVVSAALELFRSRPSLGFSDCLMIEIARKAGHLPLGTFDRALGRVEGAQRL